MGVHIYRRKGETPYWQAQVYIGGKRYRFSCQTDDKETAREYARLRVAELRARHNRGLIGLPEPVRVSEVFNRYQRDEFPKLRPTWQDRAGWIMRDLRAWFTAGRLGDPVVCAVTPADIASYLDHKARTGVSAKTVNLYRALLHRIFGLCVRPWQLVQINPVSATEKRHEEPYEPVLLKPTEYEAFRLAAQSNAMLHLFVTLAWETGARSGELLQLEWSDVDFERRLVTFANDPSRGRHTKGHRSRQVPLSGEATQALREHATRFRLLTPSSRHVFKHVSPKNGEPGSRIGSLYWSFKPVAHAIGLPKLRPHDLRHAFVTRKLAEGVPAQLVMRYVGHADLATTLRYTHLVPEHLRVVVERVLEDQVATG